MLVIVGSTVGVGRAQMLGGTRGKKQKYATRQNEVYFFHKQMYWIKKALWVNGKIHSKFPKRDSL